MHTDKPPLRTIQDDGQSLKDAATEQLIRWVITGDDAERASARAGSPGRPTRPASARGGTLL